MPSPVETTVEAPDVPRRAKSRRLLPQFGLRALFVIAVAFCLACGWVGRSAYRVRQEEAAIEALMRANSAIVLENDQERELHPATPVLGTEPTRPKTEELIARTFGWSKRRAIKEVVLNGEDPNDPKVASALAALAALAVFPEIHGVDLRGPAFDDDAVAALTKLPRLRRLHLYRTGISGEALASLAETASIEELHLSTHEPPRGVASAIGAFDELRVVNLEGLPLSRSDVEGIAALPRLEELYLSQVEPLGQDVFAPLADAKRLRRFYGIAFDMDDDDMTALARLPNVERLCVNASDAGLERLLNASPKLQELVVYGTATREAAIEFSRKRSEVSVGYQPETNDGRYYRAGLPE